MIGAISSTPSSMRCNPVPPMREPYGRPGRRDNEPPRRRTRPRSAEGGMIGRATRPPRCAGLGQGNPRRGPRGRASAWRTCRAAIILRAPRPRRHRAREEGCGVPRTAVSSSPTSWCSPWSAMRSSPPLSRADTSSTAFPAPAPRPSAAYRARGSGGRGRGCRHLSRDARRRRPRAAWSTGSTRAAPTTPTRP